MRIALLLSVILLACNDKPEPVDPPHPYTEIQIRCGILNEPEGVILEPTHPDYAEWAEVAIDELNEELADPKSAGLTDDEADEVRDIRDRLEECMTSVP